MSFRYTNLWCKINKMSNITTIVVEDEPAISELIAVNLNYIGHKVLRASDTIQAENLIKNRLPDLIILDWMLPGISGVDLARRLRKDDLTAQIPLLMLTARTDEADVLKSFDSGVDDYMSKPFSPRELIARIKALLRRSGAPEDDLLEDSGIRIELTSHRVSINGKALQIGPTEYRLLELFMRNPDRVFERDAYVIENGPSWVAKLGLLLRLAALLHRHRSDAAEPKVLLTRSIEGGPMDLELCISNVYLDEHPLTKLDLQNEVAHLQIIGINLCITTDAQI